MMKKIIFMLTAMVLILCFVTGCGRNNPRKIAKRAGPLIVSSECPYWTDSKKTGKITFTEIFVQDSFGIRRISFKGTFKPDCDLYQEKELGSVIDHDFSGEDEVWNELSFDNRKGATSALLKEINDIKILTLASPRGTPFQIEGHFECQKNDRKRWVVDLDSAQLSSKELGRVGYSIAYLKEQYPDNIYYLENSSEATECIAKYKKRAASRKSELKKLGKQLAASKEEHHELQRLERTWNQFDRFNLGNKIRHLQGSLQNTKKKIEYSQTQIEREKEQFSKLNPNSKQRRQSSYQNRLNELNNKLDQEKATIPTLEQQLTAAEKDLADATQAQQIRKQKIEKLDGECKKLEQQIIDAWRK